MSENNHADINVLNLNIEVAQSETASEQVPVSPGQPQPESAVVSTQNTLEQTSIATKSTSNQSKPNTIQNITRSNANISNIDGVFTNMQITNSSPADMTKKISVCNSSGQDDILPKYEDVAHLSPPKYSDIFRNNPSLSSSLDFNEVELNGLIVGGWEVFFGFCTLTLVFNVIGFFVSMLLTDSYAGKYGSCFGLGLLILASGIFNFPFSLGSKEGNIGKGQDAWNRVLSISFICLGTLTCVLCFALYRRIRTEIARYNEISASV